MSKSADRRGSSRSSSASPQYVSPYEFTKTGLIGDQRDTMLQSELQTLVRPISNEEKCFSTFFV
jgi:hypothetical protein